MSLKNFFTDFKKKQYSRRLDRLVKKLCAEYGQTYDRIAAADMLDEMEGEEAIYALLQRFTKLISKITEDEDEKQYVSRLILRKGEKAIPSLVRYIKEEENLAYPLKILRQIAGDEKTKQILLDAIKSFKPEYNRNPEKKIEVIKAFQDFSGNDIIEALLPFIEDPQDDVVLAVLDVFESQNLSEEELRPLLIEQILSEEEKPRVKKRILEFFVNKKWTVKGYRKRVEAVLLDGFYLDKKGHVKKLGEG